jgi:hypothetical protein
LADKFKELSMDTLYKALSALPREVLLYYILQLMLDEKLSFTEITEQHIKYLEAVKKGAQTDYLTLQNKIVETWCGTKKREHSNLREIMRYLKDRGRVNITDEQLDSR